LQTAAAMKTGAASPTRSIGSLRPWRAGWGRFMSGAPIAKRHLMAALLLLACVGILKQCAGRSHRIGHSRQFRRDPWLFTREPRVEPERRNAPIVAACLIAATLHAGPYAANDKEASDGTSGRAHASCSWSVNSVNSPLARRLSPRSFANSFLSSTEPGK